VKKNLPPALERLDTGIAEWWGASESTADLIHRMYEIYVDHRLIRGDQEVPLYRKCPNSSNCWTGPESERPEANEAGVAAPFIGPRYGESRICVVAMNFGHGGRIDTNWWLAHLHATAQRAQRRGYKGRPFAYGAMAYVNLVEASLRTGEIPTDWEEPAPERLAELWASCAVIQSVKCSPARQGGEPYPPMFSHCTDLLLRSELELLKPKVIIALGRPEPRDALRQLFLKRYEEPQPPPGRFEHDTLEITGASVTLFSVNHPSSVGWWRESLAQLAAHLQSRAVPGD